VLSGLLLATYVREPGQAEPATTASRSGTIGGLLSFLAVGCPVCNKIALIALGYSGALQWFAPLQPVLAVVGVALLAATVLRGGVQSMQRMYVLQHAGMHLALAWAFASTLRPGRTPLVTTLALRVHARLTPAMQRYTQRLTVVWSGYFVGMIAASATLYALAPWSWWSLFGNVLSPLLATGLFVLERLWRHRRHPEFGRASLAAAWQAWQTSPTSGRSG